MHKLLVQDMDRTMRKLDMAHYRFCKDNSSRVSQLHKGQEEAKKLLGTVQMALN